MFFKLFHKCDFLNLQFTYKSNYIFIVIKNINIQIINNVFKYIDCIKRYNVFICTV